MTTFTIFAETSDGRITSRSAVYSNARAGTGTLIAIDNASQGTFMGNQFVSPNYSVFQGFYDFDTSAIPVSDTIDSATVSLHGTTVPVQGDPLNAEMRIKDWGPTLTTSDFVAGANLSSNTRIALFNAGSWSTNVYNDFTSDAAFLTEIIAGGNTRMFVSSSATRLNITPTAVNRLENFFANEPGTTNDPKLVVETTTNPADLTTTINIPIQSFSITAEAASAGTVTINVPIQTIAGHIDIDEATDLTANISVPIQTLAAAIDAAQDTVISIAVPIQTLAAEIDAALETIINIDVPIQTIAAHIDLDEAKDVTASINVPIQAINVAMAKLLEPTVSIGVPIQTIAAHLDVDEAVDLTASISIPIQTISAAITAVQAAAIGIEVPIQVLSVAGIVARDATIAINVPIQTLKVNGSHGSVGELSSMSPIAEVIALMETGPLGLQSAFLGTPVDL